METFRGNIYDYPKYYDVLFGADCQAELKFLRACFQRFATIPVRRLLEPACGTGRLLVRLARQGFEVAGLDINPKAVAFCNARLRRHGFPPTAWVGDMANFRVKRKFDAGFNTINSFRHLQEDRAAVSHLRCMREAVRKGGLYVLGFHLTPNRPPTCTQEAWVARKGFLQVNSLMQTLSLDRQRREERVYLQFDIYTPRKCFRIADEFVFRTYTGDQFFRILKKAGGWEIVATYDFAYRISEPIVVDDGTEDVVFVLRAV